MRLLQFYAETLVAAQLKHSPKPVLVSHQIVEVEKPARREEREEESKE
jgi:hypothetical protein